MSREKSLLPRNILCTCDGCGQAGKCGDNEPCPPSWYYTTYTEYSETQVIACSKECCDALAWQRQP